MNFLRFAVLIVLFVLILGIFEAQAAQVYKSPDIKLDDVIVTPRRTQVEISHISENVTVISEEEIQALPARNLSEVLEYVPGVDIEPRQGFGRPTSVSIQGSDSRQVRVMIDGIPLNTQSSGQVNLVQFPVENISRIEVIKGTASSIWGSSLGGVINIITKDPGDTPVPKGNYTSSFSEFRTSKDSAEVSGKTGNLGYYLFSSYMDSGGRGLHDDVLEKKAHTKLVYDLKEAGKITTSYGYSQAEVNSGEFPDGTWQAQPYQAGYGKIGWENYSEDISMSIDLKQSRQKVITKSYLSVTDAEPFSRVFYNDILYQLSLNSSIHPREEDILVLGADFDWNTVKSTHLDKAKSLKLQAPYANYTLGLEPWVLNFGLRYDDNSEFGQEFSPALGAVYHLENVPDTLIRAGVARAHNAPPLLWKYYERVVLGLTADNPGIKPEHAWVYEGGIESRAIPKLWMKLSLYRSDVTDAIGNAQNDSGLWYKKNFEKFRRQGVELQLELSLCEKLNLFSAAAFNDIENRATRQTVRGGGKPRQSFDLGAEYKNENGLTCSLRGYYNRWNQPASSEPNDRKMLFDLKLSKDFKNIILFLNIYNLTNSSYWADIFFPVAERYFEGGVTFNW